MLSNCVRFVTDFLPKKVAATSVQMPVMLMSSALFSDESAAQVTAAKILQTHFKKNLVQCGYKDVALVPLGYNFSTQPTWKAYQLQVVRTVALHQVRTVFVLSGLAVLVLQHQLHRFYPSAQARHIATLNG